MDKIIRGSRRNFFIVDNGIFDESLQLDPLDKLVYICLLRYADNNTREAYPGQQKIADDCGITRQRVNISIKQLQNVGLVEKRQRFDKHGAQKSNLYIVFDANEVINKVSTEITGGVNEDYRGCNSGLQEGVNEDYTKKTYLKILNEKEGLQFEEQDQTLAKENIGKLKKLITG